MSSKTPPNPDDPNSLAIIDGALCRMNRKGRAVVRHAPIGTAVVQFLNVGDRLIVREHAFGFLQGFSNLYCLDAALRLIWFAELPAESDLYAGTVTAEAGVLVCDSADGCTCRIDAASGRIVERTRSTAAPVAANELSSAT